METHKKHIEIHIDIDKAADQLNVQIVAEKLTAIDLLVCCLSTVSSAASTIADATNDDEQKVLRDNRRHGFGNGRRSTGQGGNLNAAIRI